MNQNTSGLYTFENVNLVNVSQQKDPLIPVTSYMLYKVGKLTSIYCRAMKGNSVCRSKNEVFIFKGQNLVDINLFCGAADDF